MHELIKQNSNLTKSKKYIIKISFWIEHETVH